MNGGLAARQLPEPDGLGILDHDGARCKVTEPLTFAVDEQDDETDAVAVRQEVDDPYDIPDAGLHEGHRLAPVPHRPEPENLLADRLPRPEGLGRPEVTEDDDEPAQDGQQVCDDVEACLADRDRSEGQAQQDSTQDQQVEDLGDRPRAESRDLVAERHPFGRRDDQVGIR